MKQYQITGPGGEIVALLSCSGLLFDLNQAGEHVIPYSSTPDDYKVQAVRIVLGDGFRLEEVD